MNSLKGLIIQAKNVSYSVFIFIVPGTSDILVYSSQYCELVTVFSFCSVSFISLQSVIDVVATVADHMKLNLKIWHLYYIKISNI